MGIFGKRAGAPTKQGNFGVRVEAHLGSDAQANRRSMSVRNTLLEVERRVHRGRKI